MVPLESLNHKEYIARIYIVDLLKEHFKVGDPTTIDDYQHIIKCINMNEDGVVTFEEFYAMPTMMELMEVLKIQYDTWKTLFKDR
jgi:regulator of RNase E activity RraB